MRVEKKTIDNRGTIFRLNEKNTSTAMRASGAISEVQGRKTTGKVEVEWSNFS